MNLSPDEAKEALAAIQKVTDRTRHSIASSGAYIFLIITGVIWLSGFLSTQFLPNEITTIVWVGTSLLGSAAAVLLGSQNSKRVRGPALTTYAKRAGFFWLLLILYAVAFIAIAQPTDGKQMTLYIILFVMLGQLAMGLLLSFSSVWWALPISALALAGYFLFPHIFYLWMGVLVGGGMVALGLYIRLRW